MAPAPLTSMTKGAARVSKARLHQCSYCDKAFKTCQSRRQHEITTHKEFLSPKELKKYACYCSKCKGKTWATVTKLRRHQQRKSSGTNKAQLLQKMARRILQKPSTDGIDSILQLPEAQKYARGSPGARGGGGSGFGSFDSAAASNFKASSAPADAALVATATGNLSDSMLGRVSKRKQRNEVEDAKLLLDFCISSHADSPHPHSTPKAGGGKGQRKGFPNGAGVGREGKGKGGGVGADGGGGRGGIALSFMGTPNLRLPRSPSL